MKPIIYFQSTNNGALPSNRDSFRWTEETEMGTVLTGDGLTTGVFLGNLTNAQSSGDFDVVISHNAVNEITGVKFYFQPTTNNRSGGTGFTSTADTNGALADFNELVKWGTDSFTAKPNTGVNDGMFLIFKDETRNPISCQLRTGFMNSLEHAKALSNSGKGGVGGAEDTIQPFDGFSGSDYAHIKLNLSIPESLEDAGRRQGALFMRLVYSFALSGFAVLCTLSSGVPVIF